MEKITWIFQKSEWFWFVVPKEKTKYLWDYFISLKDFSNAKDWDLVEIEVLKKSKWKNKQAKILKVLKTKLENKIKDENIIWTYSLSKDWTYGFVDTLDGLQGYYVHRNNKKDARSGDIVEASIKIFNWKKEAVIERVIERKNNMVVWKFEIAKWNYWFVIPKDKSLKNDVFVALTNAMWAHSWDIVWVEITKYTSKNPEWVIKEIISKKWSLDKREEDIKTISVEMWAKITFSDEIQKFLEKIEENISKKELEKRVDLRNLFTFTIDWIDAKDLDDAISVEKLKNWDYKLYVHIADVSNYVPEDSPLDLEAKARWTSIYLADRVIPMLPTKLSNNLCSLNPYTDKLTLTCEMHIWWKTGHLVKSKVYESIINSDFRLTYREVDKILDKTINSWDILDFRWEATKELLDTLSMADDLKENILNFRAKNGSLDFDFPETYVTFDEEWNPSWVKQYPKHYSNKLIEVFMISANEAISKEFSKFPFLYRIHEKPKDFDIIELENKLKLFWIKFKFQKADTKEFSELLNKLKELDDAKRRFLEKITLRTLTQAMYSHINFGHFWLALEFYSHFTSPIRRYPDLQIHRIIKEYLNHKLKKDRISHYKNILPNVAKLSSERERLSEKIEYKVRDYFMVKYYKDKIWEEFHAVISGLVSKWFFISLDNTVEWFVELEKSQFDEKAQTHRFSGKNYMLWQDIKVRLIEADEELLRLNFEIVENK